MSRIPAHYTLGLLALAASVVVAACSDRPTAPVTEPSAARGAAPVSLVPSSLEWQSEARALVKAKVPNAYLAGRVYAVLSIAQYLAVTEADRHFDVEGPLPEHGLGEGGRRLLEARRGAVAGASATVLAFFFPADVGTFEQRVQQMAAAGTGGVHPHFLRGLEIGRSAGHAMVERASQDHFNDTWAGAIPPGYSLVPGEGVWFGSGKPAGAMLVLTTPYLLISASQFRTAIAPPPPFRSPDFLAALDEIRTIVFNRTHEQLASAIDWNFPAGGDNPTISAPGYWNLTAATYIAADGLDERRATHLLALMHAALADAQIACWDAKFTYWVLRPTQAEAVIYPADKVIAARLPFAVPNHPSYPSGHSCLSGAAARVLSLFFRDDARTEALGRTVTEMGLSREYAGIHYAFDVRAGRALGEAVADWEFGLDQSAGLLTALKSP